MMGNKYDVKMTPQALRQMQETKQYIRVTFQAPNSAQKWLEQMKEEISTLSSIPARIPLVDDEP